MNPKDKAWTYQEEQQLIDLKCEGKSYLEIAEIMGRTPDSLRKKHFLLMKQAYTPGWWERIKKNEPEVKVSDEEIKKLEKLLEEK